MATLCAVSLFALLPACKKAEQPAASNPPAERPAATAAESKEGTPAKAAGDQAQAVTLKIRWPLGNRYVYRMDLDQHSTNTIPQMPKPIQQDVAMAMTYALTVAAETPAGGRELEMEFLANEMEIKMGEQVMMSFDSKEAPKNESQNPFATPFRKMIGSKLRLQLDAEGKVDKLVGFEEWQNNLAGDGGGAAKMILSQQFGEDYFRQIADFSRGLPPKPVTIGDTWPLKLDLPAGPMGKININATVMHKGFEDQDGHRCAVLDSVGTLKGGSAGGGPTGKMNIEQGKLNGTTWFDPELGAMINSSSEQHMRIKGEMPGPQGGGSQFTSDIAQKVSLKLVELTKADKEAK